MSFFFFVMNRGKQWCFTLNNFSENDIDTILDWPCRYLVFGKEVGVEGTPHLQGYVQFNKTLRFSQLKKLNERIHWEQARGSPKQASDYCKKDGDFTEVGKMFSPGAATQEKWEHTLACAKEGRIDEICAEHQIRYQGAIKRLRLNNVPANIDVEHYWYYGPTGTGKSRSAREEYPDAYIKDCTKWWDDYDLQSVVIIEDFDIQHAWMGHYLKIWGDRYKFRAEFKGGSMMVRPLTIIVTSNWEPREIWSDDNTLLPILRRFTLRRFGPPQVPPMFIMSHT